VTSVIIVVFSLICLAGIALLVAGLVLARMSNRGSGVSDARQGWINEGSDRRD
jgi:hypothetical protein